METAKCLVAPGGNRNTTVPKYDVTPAEAAVLRELHGLDAVFDIEIIGEVQRTHRQEIARLTERYGRQEGERRVSPAVSQLFPGAAARVFETFDELEIPEEFYIATGRKTKRTVPQARTAPAAPQPAPTPLASMTINQLRAHADKIGVDLTGITRKADMIEALALKEAEAQEAPADDTAEEDDPEDNTGEINDQFSEKENLFK